MPFTAEIFSLNKSGDVAPRPGTGLRQLVGGKRLVLSRALCSYDWVERDHGLKNEIALKRAHLSALEKSPFDHTGVFLKASEHGVSVWSWDADRVQQDAKFPNLLCIPESAQLEGLYDGFYIIECIDGFEGLFLRDGAIRLSRWWPTNPTESEWTRFAYNAEMFGVQLQESFVPKQLDRKTIAHNTPPNDLPSRELVKMSNLGRLISIAILVGMLVTSYPVGRWLHLKAGSQLLQSEMNELSSTFEAQLDVIRERSEVSSAVSRLIEIMPKASLLPAFADAVQMITEKGGGIEQILYADEIWEISFSASDDFSETDLVRIMEESAYLTAVSVEADRRDNRWIAKFQNATDT